MKSSVQEAGSRPQTCCLYKENPVRARSMQLQKREFLISNYYHPLQKNKKKIVKLL